jgi:vancomycin resistance protein VanW
VRAHQLRRHVAWLGPGTAWARQRCPDPLAVPVFEHRSPLVRRLGPIPDLQRGKVTNLRLAAARTDGLLIGPGETFSFHRSVGNCTRRRGYVEGMCLSDGSPSSGVGGGICQLSNLLHWLFLHSPLTVLERSEHSYDPFPDRDRVVPWGVGATVVYNYVDLVVRNDTESTFQLRTWVETDDLRGELLADHASGVSYAVAARHEEFVRIGGEVWRRNEIWRTTMAGGDVLAEELVRRNLARVRYHPADELVRDA